MKGDFSRNSFNPTNHFARVLMQQGRVTVDADWNEEQAIREHRLRSVIADIIGRHGGPGDSFKIVGCVDEMGKIPRNDDGTVKECGADQPDDDFLIYVGHYYVNGILCENEQLVGYKSQPDYPEPIPWTEDGDGDYLVYLDVWERHITAKEDERIREVALGGPDTATRAKIIWQVKIEKLTEERKEILDSLRDPDAEVEETYCQIINAKLDEIVNAWWQPENRGYLQALANPTEEMDLENPCTITPDARYRGAENQLYRVEIHKGNDDDESKYPTFKWSRENGSVVFPIKKAAAKVITLAHLGRDGRFTLQEGDWIEPVNDDTVLKDEPQDLCRVQEVNRIDMTVTLDKAIIIDVDEAKHPLLRRWDQKKRKADSQTAVPNQYGVAIELGWLVLEDGIQIQFEDPNNQNSTEPEYRSGDYWLIPARTATGDVEWPQQFVGKSEQPKPLPPQGVSHHFAPLAIIEITGDGIEFKHDCRYVIEQAAKPAA